MTLKVRATLACDSCHRTITVEGGSGTNATEVRDVAKRTFGWATSKERDLCFDDRLRPINFHDYEEEGLAGWATCVVCGLADFGAKRGEPYHPAHNRARIEREAARLRLAVGMTYR